MDIFHTEDRSVSKYIHDDGSETAVKIVPSARTILNPLMRRLERRETPNDKYSVFISSSQGCYMKCKFCHLTLKNCAYSAVPAEALADNVKEALADKAATNPEIAGLKVKLSWMGMGDAVNRPREVRQTSLDLIDWIGDKGYASGIDKVDLSTVLPPVRDDWLDEFSELDASLQDRRSQFRLFYSLQSAVQERRDFLIPTAMPLEQAAKRLDRWVRDGRILIFHHMVIDGVNDRLRDTAAVADFIVGRFPDCELRLLRYNHCRNSPFGESPAFYQHAEYLSDRVHKLKIQISPGSEVQAACGQFIVREYREKGKIRAVPQIVTSG